MSFSIAEVIGLALEHKASDVHLKAEQAPVFRIDGQLIPLSFRRISREELNAALLDLLDENQRQRFQENMELDAAFVFPKKARVRLNLYADIYSMGCAMRVVPLRVPNLDELGLPAVIEKMTRHRSGLVLVCGVTGAGKSTTLAAMVDAINSREAVHVYTIEDPIEFVHEQKMALITQREIGFSTKSFSLAVRSALRADPNVLLIGEMRDTETILAALKAAESGLFVMSTLHTHSATRTIQRILGLFEAKEQEAVKMQLAYALRAVICQQLLPLANGGRRAFHEIMINTPSIQEAIFNSDFDKLQEYIKNGAYDGMCAMDESIYNSYCAGEIDGATAREYSIDREEMERSLLYSPNR